MSTSEKSAENRPEIGQNSKLSNQARICLNCDKFFPPADLDNYKLAYSVIFGMEYPTSVELYCPNCVEVLGQAMIESSQPWEYPTHEELEAALDLNVLRDEYD